MAGSSMWAWELKVLRMKRSAPYRNSLQEEFCDIQLTPSVTWSESFRARCMATAMGPPEEKMATCLPRWAEARNLVRPEFTRAQNSCQVSTPCGVSSAFTHLPMTVSNNFWNVARCVGWSGEDWKAEWRLRMLSSVSSNWERVRFRTSSAWYSSNSGMTCGSGKAWPAWR